MDLSGIQNSESGWLNNLHASATPARALSQSFGFKGQTVMPLKYLVDEMLDDMKDSLDVGYLNQDDGDLKDIKKMFMRILRKKMKTEMKYMVDQTKTPLESEDNMVECEDNSIRAIMVDRLSGWKSKSTQEIEEQLIAQLKNGKISSRVFIHLYEKNKKAHDVVEYENTLEKENSDWQPASSDDIIANHDEARLLAISFCEGKSNNNSKKFCMNRLKERVADIKKELNFLRSIFDDEEVEEIMQRRYPEYKTPVRNAVDFEILIYRETEQSSVPASAANGDSIEDPQNENITAFGDTEESAPTNNVIVDDGTGMFMVGDAKDTSCAANWEDWVADGRIPEDTEMPEFDQCFEYLLDHYHDLAEQITNSLGN